MEEMILGGVGAAAAVIGLTLFLRALMCRLRCGVCTGKAVNCDMNSKGWYMVVMEYTVGGAVYHECSEAVYSQPIESGTEKVLLYDKEKPHEFYFADAIRINLLGFGLLTVIGVLMVLRFWVL